MAICSSRRDTASESESELNYGERNADIQSESELKLKVCIRRSLIDDCKANYAGEYNELNFCERNADLQSESESGLTSISGSPVPQAQAQALHPSVLNR